MENRHPTDGTPIHHTEFVNNDNDGKQKAPSNTDSKGKFPITPEDPIAEPLSPPEKKLAKKELAAQKKALDEAALSPEEPPADIIENPAEIKKQF